MVLTRSPIPGIFFLFTLLLAACGTGQALRPVSGEDPGADARIKARFAAWSDETPAYRVGEGDKLRILFPLTPEMNDDVVVRPDGMVTLRLGGEVMVADLTPAAASEAVARSAAGRLRDPQVVVSVQDPVSACIYVGGEVRSPGVWRMNGPMSTIAALQLASGVIETARLDKVILIRRAPDGRPMLRLVDLRALLEGKDVTDPRIFPGDILYVPRSRIAEVDLWVNQFIERVVPFQRTFNYTLGHSTTSGTGGAF